jgi:hypothetical protein
LSEVGIENGRRKTEELENEGKGRRWEEYDDVHETEKEK